MDSTASPRTPADRSKLSNDLRTFLWQMRIFIEQIGGFGPLNAHLTTQTSIPFFGIRKGYASDEEITEGIVYPACDENLEPIMHDFVMRQLNAFAKNIPPYIFTFLYAPTVDVDRIRGASRNFGFDPVIDAARDVEGIGLDVRSQGPFTGVEGGGGSGFGFQVYCEGSTVPADKAIISAGGGGGGGMECDYNYMHDRAIPVEVTPGDVGEDYVETLSPTMHPSPQPSAVPTVTVEQPPTSWIENRTEYSVPEPPKPKPVIFWTPPEGPPVLRHMRCSNFGGGGGGGMQIYGDVEGKWRQLASLGGGGGGGTPGEHDDKKKEVYKADYSFYEDKGRNASYDLVDKYWFNDPTVSVPEHHRALQYDWRQWHRRLTSNTTQYADGVEEPYVYGGNADADADPDGFRKALKENTIPTLRQCLTDSGTIRVLGGGGGGGGMVFLNCTGCGAVEHGGGWGFGFNMSFKLPTRFFDDDAADEVGLFWDMSFNPEAGHNPYKAPWDTNLKMESPNVVAEPQAEQGLYQGVVLFCLLVAVSLMVAMRWRRGRVRYETLG